MIIKGKALLDNKKIEEVCIEIEDGIIVNISKLCKGNNILDFTGKNKVILPGMVDIHVHLRDFQLDYKEDFYTGTSAAAAGGVVLVMDMPNTKPEVNRISVLRRRAEVASKKAIVDYGLYYGVPNKRKEIGGYERYAVGLKVYPMDMYNNILNDILRYNSEKNILTVFHAEDPAHIDGGHPLIAEIKAAYMIALKSKELGLKAHITHLSSGVTYRIIKEFNKSVTTDTCPHYLFLSRDNHIDKYYNVNPPLRNEVIRRDLFNLFRNCKIDILSTDHAPHTIEEKYEEGLSGFPGLETALPLMLDLYSKGLISLRDIALKYSYNPAKLFGINHLYGSIKVGKYASLVVVNLGRSYKIKAENFHSKAKHSPFDGWTVNGVVEATMVRGKLVYKDGEIVGKMGYGINVKYKVINNDKEPQVYVGSN